MYHKDYKLNITKEDLLKVVPKILSKPEKDNFTFKISHYRQSWYEQYHKEEKHINDKLCNLKPEDNTLLDDIFESVKYEILVSIKNNNLEKFKEHLESKFFKLWTDFEDNFQYNKEYDHTPSIYQNFISIFAKICETQNSIEMLNYFDEYMKSMYGDNWMVRGGYYYGCKCYSKYHITLEVEPLVQNSIKDKNLKLFNWFYDRKIFFQACDVYGYLFIETLPEIREKLLQSRKESRRLYKLDRDLEEIRRHGKVVHSCLKFVRFLRGDHIDVIH
jgi:hypothetical protein